MQIKFWSKKILINVCTLFIRIEEACVYNERLSYLPSATCSNLVSRMKKKYYSLRLGLLVLRISLDRQFDIYKIIYTI
jgi:hypothetical protein